MSARIAALILSSAAAAAPAPLRRSRLLHKAIGAPTNLKLGGSVRTRYESISGQVRPGFNDEDDLFSVRTTFLAEYDIGALRFGGEIYDSRAYGADERTPIGTGEVNTFEPVQAYVAADFKLGEQGAGTLQAGRFTMNLGSRRIVASDDYRNATNSYTGLRADLSPSKALAATLFFVLPQTRLPDDLPSILENETALDRESFDALLWGGFLTAGRILPGRIVETYYVGFRERDAEDRPTRDRRLHNLGLRVAREPAAGRLDYVAEGIYQFGGTSLGLAPAAQRADVSAYFYHLESGYSFAGKWKPRLSVEYDRASGDAAGGDYGRFDTLFGMRRADLAPAGIYSAIGRANISSPGVRLELTPGKRTDAFLAYRALWAEEETDSFSTTGVRDPLGASGAFAGHQLDGRLRHWIVPKLLRGEVNAVWLGKGRLLERAPNAPDNGDSFYLSVATQLSF